MEEENMKTKNFKNNIKDLFKLNYRKLKEDVEC